MANGLFVAWKNATYKADVDLDNAIKVVCVDHADDTPVVATDDFLDDIGAAARVATSGNLASKTFGTVAGGTFDAADTTVSAVTGDVFESLVGYYDSTVAGTSNLIWYQDTGTGLPFTPSGGDVLLVWSASGIIAISG